MAVIAASSARRSMVGVFAYLVIENYARDIEIPGLGFGGTLFGGSFNTIIGVIFLLIVIASPTGVMGFWERVTRAASARFGRGAAAAAVREPGSSVA